MIKSRKKKTNRYQESTLRRLKGNFYTFRDFFAVFVLFCFVVTLGAGLSKLYYEITNAPWFKLEEIEITGIKRLDRFEILNAMGLKRGQCALSINIERVVDRLEKLPEVSKASVRLESHGRLLAAIVERKPVAVVECSGRDMLMDHDGVLFAEAAPGEKGSLPFITGLCDSNVKKGDSIAGSSLKRIRELLAAIDNSKSWLSGATVNECRWTENGFTLVLGERAVPVCLGRGGFGQKLTRLRKVINTLNKRGWTDLVTRIDLDYPDKAYLEGQFPAPQPVQGTAKRAG